MGLHNQLIRYALLAILLFLPAIVGSLEKVVDCTCMYDGRENTRVGLQCSRKENHSNSRNHDSQVPFPSRELPIFNNVGDVSCKTEDTLYLPEGYVLLTGQGVYKVYRTSRSFADAHKACVRDGGHLAVAETSDEKSGIAWLLPMQQAWVGKDMASLHVDPDQLKPEDCVVLRNAHAALKTEPCSQAQPFVCELSLTKTPPMWYTLGRDARMLKYRLEHFRRETALRTCKGDGATLAVPRTEVQAEELLTLMDMASNIEQAYVGLVYQEGRGFVTDGGVPSDLLDFRNWIVENGTETRHCATFHRDGYLRAVSCDRYLPFFCEMPLPLSL